MTHASRDRRAEKRERFAQARKTKRQTNLNILLTAIAALVALAVIYFSFAGSNKSSVSTVATSFPADASSSSEIAIPLSEVSSGQAKFYQYKAANRKTVRFFVIKSSDGVYRAAADACDVCYREKIGYHQEGNDLVCNKCRKHFPSANVNVITGGCNPDGIPRTIKGDKLMIAASELETRAELF